MAKGKASPVQQAVGHGLAIESKKRKKGKKFIIFAILIAVASSLFVFRKPINSFLSSTLKDVPIVGTWFKDEGGESVISYEALAKELAQSQGEVASLKMQLEELENKKTTLEIQVEALKQYEQNYESFKAQKNAWDEALSKENEELFITQFESFYPETAERLYMEIKGDRVVTKEQKSFSNTIAQMDSDQAAKALELLIGTDPELIQVIFKQMGQEQRALILSSMTSEAAAKVIKLISPDINMPVD